jgi:hypothetical protein
MLKVLIIFDFGNKNNNNVDHNLGESFSFRV